MQGRNPKMSGPRIVFMRFASSNSVKLRGWREHRASVLGSSFVGDHAIEPGSAVIWRLVSSNNRELARSAELFTHFQDALDSARDASAGVDDSIVRHVSDDRHGLYGWYLTRSDTPVAVCSRWYQADRERRHAVAMATEGLAKATFADGARALINSDAQVES